MKKSDPMRAMMRLGEVRHQTTPITTGDREEWKTLPQTPVILVMRGIDTSWLISLLNSQPVWMVLITAPIAVAKLNTDDVMPNFFAPNFANETSHKVASHVLQNSPISPMT